jgi:aquaporin Z
MNMKKLLAELLGTFGLVLFGTGAIIVDQLSGGAITHAGIALAFGLAVMVMIFTFGDISGAHFNPAVTIAFCALGRFPRKQVLPYIGAQLLGAIAASFLLRILFIESSTLGETIPNGSAFRSFLLEVILSATLMLTIISVSSGSKEKGVMAAIAIGAIVLLEALVFGSITGASMNPARSLAPALAAQHFDNVWIYLMAPPIGTLLATFLWKTVKGDD